MFNREPRSVSACICFPYFSDLAYDPEHVPPPCRRTIPRHKPFPAGPQEGMVNFPMISIPKQKQTVRRLIATSGSAIYVSVHWATGIVTGRSTPTFSGLNKNELRGPQRSGKLCLNRQQFIPITILAANPRPPRDRKLDMMIHLNGGLLGRRP